MRTVSLLVFSAVLSLLSIGPAKADPIVFGGTATAVKASDITFGASTSSTPKFRTAAAYDGVSLRDYKPGLSGTEYITHQDVHNAPTENTTYAQKSSAYGGEKEALSFDADNAVKAYLNSTLVGSAVGSNSFVTDGLKLAAGDNNLKSVVTNFGQHGRNNPTSFDFAGKAVTPEPGTLVLVGTGLIGVATLVRRRAQQGRQQTR